MITWQYTHRNGESILPTVRGWYWMKDGDDGEFRMILLRDDYCGDADFYDAEAEGFEVIEQALFLQLQFDHLVGAD